MIRTPIEIQNSDHDDLLCIDIYPTNICNYSCHYCHPGSNEGNHGFPKDFDLYVKNIDHLLNVYKENFNKKRIKIEISGGEPTLWPRIGDFANHLKLNHRLIRRWRQQSSDGNNNRQSPPDPNGDQSPPFLPSTYAPKAPDCGVFECRKNPNRK